MHLDKRRVILVENEDSVRMAFEAYLRGAGYHAATMWSGIEALSLLKSSFFDVLLVDTYIADLHVGGFLKQVSRLRAQPQVLVMQAKPTQRAIRFKGTIGSWPLVDKTEIADVIQAVEPDFPQH